MTTPPPEDDVPPLSEVLPLGALSVDPLPRDDGARADVCFTAARLADAVDEQDAEAERRLGIELARKYAARGTDLDEALRLALRALELGEDPALRSEVSGWLGGVGEPSLAAAELELVARLAKAPRTRARTWMRAAVLRARSGEIQGARDLLVKAADADPTDAIALELVGTFSSWSSLPAIESARAYVQAASRREQAGDEEAAFEDRLRAFEASPGSPEVADALRSALVARGRTVAADEVLVKHASTIDGDARRAVHLRRFREAILDGDVPRALGAMLDAGLEVGERALSGGTDLREKVDDVLARAGLYELVAAREHARARTEQPKDARATFEGLARLYGGQLGRPDLRLDALVCAVALDPSSASAREALAEHAEREGDREPLAEALTRAALSEDTTTAIEALRHLADAAEHHFEEPSLALWAYTRLEKLGGADPEVLGAARARLDAGDRAETAQIGKLEAVLDRPSGALGPPSTRAEGDGAARALRISTLSELARRYRGRPDQTKRRAEVLAALLRAEPTSDEAGRAFGWLVERSLQQGAPKVDLELFASVLSRRVEAPLTSHERSATRLLLAAVAAASDPTGRRPLEAVAPLLETDALDKCACARALEIATASGASRERALAFAALADGQPAAIGAQLLAAAADEFLASNDLDAARKAADRGLALSPSSGKPARTLARVATRKTDRDSASLLERALSVLVPSTEACSALAHALDLAGEPALAFAWTQRWLALVPANPMALRELVRRAVDLADPVRLIGALSWVLAQPEAMGPLVDPMIDGLRALFALDAAKAKPLARRALDVFGPKDESLRRELIALADEHGDRGLAIAALERWIATAGDTPVAVLLELCVRRSDARDFDGAARELCRAASVGSAPDAVLESIQDVEETAKGRLSPDGRLWLAEAVARSHWEGATKVGIESAVNAFRTLGALRWDLAEDWRGSEQALFASSEASDRFDLYARDLVELAGLERAIMAIRARARLVEGKTQGRVLTAAARQAAEHGLDAVAVELAEEAIAIDPTIGEAIAVAEACARGESGAAVVSRIYELLARTAMGIYGQRAAHYRAARQLERRGANALALHHALASFEAVPNEGTSYHLVTRLIERTGDATEAIRSLERVAEQHKLDERALWLRRAASLAPATPEGLTARFDLLLRALMANPESQTVALLEDALAALVDVDDDQTIAFVRFERAVRAILAKLEGPDGAFVALRIARVTARFDLAATTWKALHVAVRNDAGHGAFAELAKVSEKLVTPEEDARAFVDSVVSSPTAGAETCAVAAGIASAIGYSAGVESLRERGAARERDAGSSVSESFDLTDDDMPADPTSEGSIAKQVADSASTGPAEPPAAVSPPEEPAPTAARSDDLEDLRLSAASNPLPPISLARRSSSGVRPLAPEITRSDPSPSIESALAIVGAQLADVPPESVPPPSIPPRAGSVPPRAQPSAEEAEKREAAAVDRGDFAAALEAVRAAVDSTTEPARRAALRVRVARYLGEALGRDDVEAEAELAAAIADDASPETLSAVAAQLDALDTSPRGQARLSVGRTPSFWSNLAREATTDERKVALGRRAISAFAAVRNGDKALLELDRVAPLLTASEVCGARVEIGRATGDQLALALALDELSSEQAFEDDAERAKILLEAAKAALASGDEPGALLRVRRANRADATNAFAAVELARLEYRTRGTGTPREAQATVDTLIAVETDLPEPLVELHAFLLAEELDVIQGGGAGMRELTHRHAAVGPLPLIALGMAERLARNRSHQAALPLFEKALQGDMQGLRNAGRVALAAADSAIQAGSIEVATRLLDDAQRYPDTRALVERRKREIEAASTNTAIARKALEELIMTSTGLARARFLERLAALTEDSDSEIAIALYEEALAAARHDRTLAERIRKALVYLRSGGNMNDDEETTSTGRRPATLVDAITRKSPRASEPPSLEAQPAPEAMAAPKERAPATDAQLSLADFLEQDLPGEAAEDDSDPSLVARRRPAKATSQSPTPKLPPPLPVPQLALPPPLPIPSVITPSPSAVRDNASADARPPPLPVTVSRAPESGSGVMEIGEAEPTDDEVAAMEEDEREDDAAHEFVDSGEFSFTEPVAPADPPRELPALPAQVSTRPKPTPPPLPPVDDAPPPSRMPASRAIAAHWPSLESPLEEELFQALRDGDFEAGEKLARTYGSGRTRDHLAVRRFQASLRLGHRPTLESLHRAAIADGSAAYARAVEHVLGMGGEHATSPPALSAQTISPEMLHRLLFKELSNPTTEALGIACEAGLMRKDIVTAGLSSAPRILPSAQHAVGEALAAISPLFGPRTLYHGKKDGEPQAHVVLLTNPVLVFEGDVRRAALPELLYLLGSNGAGTLPEFAFAASEPLESLQTLVQAISAAFGPVGSSAVPSSRSGTTSAAIARIGAELWQRVQPVAERRLRALTADSELSSTAARDAARTAMRRAGLFACGDLALAIRMALEELGQLTVPTADALESLCNEHPTIADLTRLALRMEYAESRFYGGASSMADARAPASF